MVSDPASPPRVQPPLILQTLLGWLLLLVGLVLLVLAMWEGAPVSGLQEGPLQGQSASPPVAPTPTIVRPAAIRFQRMVFHGRQGLSRAQFRAQAAYQSLLQGEAFVRVAQEQADEDHLPAPQGLVSPVEAARVVGIETVRVALQLSAGQVSPPTKIGSDFYLIQMLEIAR